MLRALHRTQRSASLAGAARTASLDAIYLRGLVFHGFHGVLPEERTLGQKFTVDIELRTDLTQAGRSDQLGDSVNYVEVWELARSHVEGTPRDLIETVAYSIVQDVLQQHAAIEEACVRVCKPHVAIPGVLEAVAVEIRRRRGEI